MFQQSFCRIPILVCLLALVSLSGLALIAGCAEGPLWRTGYLSPRVRQQWEDEERIAASLFARREELAETTELALAGGQQEQVAAAKRLAETITRDPIVLVREEAVHQLGRLAIPEALQGLQVAAADRDPSVRMAAVKALSQRSDPASAAQLIKISQSDPELNIQIAATGGLANHAGPGVVEALGSALRHSSPAMQLRAAEALASVTGEEFGVDIQAWQAYVDRMGGRERVANVDAEPTDR